MELDEKKRLETVIYCDPSESLTQQHWKDETDINLILKRYEAGGQITHLNRVEGSYGDFSQLQGFRESLDMVRSAQSAFDALPAEVRRRFDNDPAQLVDFCLNPSNLDEARKLGLASPDSSKAAQNDDLTTNNSAPNQNQA